ncbi:MAG: hypothetical protein ACI8ZB_003702 [Desulforhopalus sp.]|jgi:hypothetical protein
MIGSVSSGTSAMTMMSNSMQKPQQGKDAFQMSDTDGNGVVSQTELETMAASMEEVTGNVINVDDAIASYDTDSDGALSGEELLEMLASNGMSPPEMEGGGPPPPPPPSSEEAISAYSQNSGDDLLSQLLDSLGGSDDSEDSSIFSSLSITS